MLRSRLPVVAVCAVRTGAGKSQTSRAVVALLREAGKRVAVLRHPMPYGDLNAQRVQRFATVEDLETHRVTIEEREEYEPHIAAGSVVFAGVDYAEILAAAEREADVLVWDGGNNDTSFLEADVYITVVDPHRPGHELTYYPGETNLRLADVIVINKIDSAVPDDVETVRANVRRANPRALVLDAASPLAIDDVDVLRGRRVLAIEDGPTLTHGGMRIGAGYLAARRVSAEIIDPRPYAVGEIADTYQNYPETGPILPAMGYGEAQIRDLEATIERAVREGGVEAVVVGTPVDLGRIVRIPVPCTRVRYELQVLGRPTLRDVLAPVLGK